MPSDREFLAGDFAVCPVRSKADLRRFARLPRQLIGRDSPWVEPLKLLQNALYKPQRHPFYDHGRGAVAEFFLAKDQSTGRPIGRVAAIFDKRSTDPLRQQNPGGESEGQFGFFDCVNSPQVARSLISAAADWLRAQGIRRMVGPASPSQAYDYGLLVEGHDRPHRFLMPYHPAYYASLLEGCGLSKAKDLLSLSGDLQDPDMRRRVELFVQRTDAMRGRSSLDVTVRPVNMRQYRQEARRMGAVLNEVLENHFGHSAITEQEWRLITDSIRPFANPDFILVAEREGRPIGLAVALPDLNEIIRRLRLRVGLVEPLEFLLRSWRWRPECVCIIVVGVTREGGTFAVAPMLVGQLARNLLAHGVRYVDAHQVLEDNHLILDPLLKHGLLPDRRHRVYQMAL